MTVETAPSGMSMQVASAEITATPTATGTADIGLSAEFFSLLEPSDRYIPGEIVRDFTTELVRFDISEGTADTQDPVGDSIPELKIDQSQSIENQEIVGIEEQIINQVEPKIKSNVTRNDEKPITTVPRVYNVEENNSVRIEVQMESQNYSQPDLDLKQAANRYESLINVGFEPAKSAEKTTQEFESTGNRLLVTPRVDLAAEASSPTASQIIQQALELTEAQASTTPQTAVASEIVAEQRVEEQTQIEGEQEVGGDKTEIIFSDVVRKVDQSASKNRIEIAKKVVDQVDKDEISGFDLKFPDETELIRSRVLWQLGRYFNPDQTWPEFIKEAQRITSNTKDEVLRQIIDINSKLRPIERGGKIREASEEEEARVLGRSIDLAMARKELIWQK